MFCRTSPSKLLSHPLALCLFSLALLLPFAAPAPAQTAQTAQTVDAGQRPLVLQVRDAWTGIAVPGAVAEVPNDTGTPGTVTKAGSAGVLKLATTPATVEISAPGYQSMTLRPATTPEAVEALELADTGRTAVWLRPDERPEELRIDTIRARTAPNTSFLHGHVVDVPTGQPVAGATVTLAGSTDAAGPTTRTDERGYFQFHAQGTRVTSAADRPEVVDVVVTSDGFESVRLAHVALLEEDSHFIVDLDRGTGEEVRDMSHKMFPAGESIFETGAVAEPAISPDEARRLTRAHSAATSAMTKAIPSTVQTKATFGGLQVVDPPDQINVSGYGYIPLEVYVARGLCSEWISSWGQQSLDAGSIAYRSYGAWWQINRGYICTSTSCQVYNNAYNSKCDAASQKTSGILLELGGSVAFSEYSAENNCLYCSSYSCVNYDRSCGNNYAGSPSNGWSCLYDNHGFTGGPGRCCFGHGRGMCQWGTFDWAKQGRLWNWMVDHYYNGNGSGTGDRTTDMTTPLSITSAGTSTGSAARGSTISLSMTLRNYADYGHSDLMFGASLLGPTSHSDPAGDQTFTALARTSYSTSYRTSTVSRSFRIGSSVGTGTYDLLVAIWKDTNGNNQIDGNDLVLRTGRFDNVLDVY